jgi:hypothetical protein
MALAQIARKIKRAWGGSERDALKGIHESLSTFRFALVSKDIASLAAGAEADETFALPEADFGTVTADTHLAFVFTPSTLNAGIYIRRVWISANNVVTATFRNETGGVVNVASLSYPILVLAPRNLSTVL